MIEIYTRDGCFYCTQAKKLLVETNKEYVEYVIGKDVTRDDVIAKFPEQKVLPIVLVDGDVIGTYTDLLDYIYPAMTEFENEQDRK